MRQDDAFTKWCPFARAALDKDAPSTVAINRVVFDDGANPDPDCYCIGELCMAWRWENEALDRGFCGLAGKP